MALKQTSITLNSSPRRALLKAIFGPGVIISGGLPSIPHQGRFVVRANQLLDLIQDYSIPLIVGVIAGLVMANVDSHLYEELIDYHLFGEDVYVFGKAVTVHFLINEIFMAFFFGIAAKAITDSVLPGGALNPIPKAINPLMGMLGGVLGPAGLFFLLAYVFYGGTDDFGAVANGWGIPTATDIALAWLVARIIFGNGHPAVNFLLLLAVADDAIGLGIIAIFYPDPHHPVEPLWILLTVGGMAVAYLMRRAGVRYWPSYVLIAGGMSWVGLVKSGVEPALALVVIVPFLPASAEKPEKRADRAGRERDETALSETTEQPGDGAAARSHVGYTPLEAFEHRLKLPVDFGLFFFAFANAGVEFNSVGIVTFMVLLSLTVGKVVGVTLMSAGASLLGFPLPSGMGIRHLAIAGLIAGLGLTVALFVANKAYAGPPFQDAAKMGAVFSVVVAVLAFVIARAIGIRRMPDSESESEADRP